MKYHVLLFFLTITCYCECLGQHSELYLDKNESAFFDYRNAILNDSTRRINSNIGSVPSFSDQLAKELATLNPKYILLNKLKNVQHILSIKSNSIDLNKPSSLVQLNGMLTMELFASDFQLPYSLSEPYYMRIRATPNVSLLGLPFQTDFYYTTESKSFYNSNNITFRFDVDAFKSASKDEAKKRLDAKRNQIKQLRYVQQDIDVYKNDVSRSIRNIEEELKSSIEAKKDSFNNIAYDTSGFQKRLPDTLYSTANENDPTTHLRDSVANSVKKKSDQLDSVQQNILYLKAKLEKLQSYITAADSLKDNVLYAESILSEMVSVESLRIKSELEQRKNSRINSLVDSVKNSYLGAFIKSIEEFDIGLTNPFLSKNTVNNIPVKGLSIKKVSTSRTNHYTRLIAGKTMASFTTMFENDNQPLYSRNIIGTKIGVGLENMDGCYLISAFFWDDKTVSKPSSNLLNGFGWNNQLGKLKYEIELTHSIYNNGWTSSLGENNISSFAKLKDALSLSGNAEYKFNKNSKIKLIGDQKNHGFRSMGSPFLRNDYRTIEGKYTQKWLKGKIQSVGFYKHFVGNLSNLSELTNNMKGFGINVKSKFRKYPNFMLAYTPFEQGNNHQDSLFRTNNKFKSMIAQISYQHTKDRHSFYSIIGLNRSVIEYVNINGFKSNTTLLSFSQMYRNNKLSASVLLNRSLTEPSVDSLNYVSLNSTIRYNLKGLNLLTSLTYKVTDSHGTFYNHSIGFQKQLSQSFRFKMNAAYGYIDKLWGFKHKRTRSILCSIQYLFQ